MLWTTIAKWLVIAVLVVVGFNYVVKPMFGSVDSGVRGASSTAGCVLTNTCGDTSSSGGTSSSSVRVPSGIDVGEPCLEHVDTSRTLKEQLAQKADIDARCTTGITEGQSDAQITRKKAELQRKDIQEDTKQELDRIQREHDAARKPTTKPAPATLAPCDPSKESCK